MRVPRPGLFRPWLPPRGRAAHKGDFGHVLVLAGSRGMTGAARLCAAAALRSGAGLVTLGIPRRLQPLVARRGRWETMTLPLPDTPSGTFRAAAAREAVRFVRARRVTAVAVGPGLGATPETGRFVRELLGALDVPVVADADALNVLAAGGWPRRRRASLAVTPHPGELARLLNTSARRVQADRLAHARRLARDRDVLCVLKGHRTIVTDGRAAFVNPTGNPGMATGGSGDVLTGAIAALAGQTRGADAPERLLRAALIGVYAHGLAGDLAARTKTRLSLTAGDVLESLPAAFRKMFGPRI